MHMVVCYLLIKQLRAFRPNLFFVNSFLTFFTTQSFIFSVFIFYSLSINPERSPNAIYKKPKKDSLLGFLVFFFQVKRTRCCFNSAFRHFMKKIAIFKILRRSEKCFRNLQIFSSERIIIY